MDCFPDFCLACDNQTADGLYCSQACRLTDLEKAGSAPESPTTPSHLSTSSGFFLAPALDFGTYRPRTAQQSSLAASSKDESGHDSVRQQSPQHHSTPSHTSSPRRVLSPSSSRSSLVSGLSGLTTQTTEGLSEQAKTELREYVNSFDQTREWRRRSNPCTKQRSSISQTVELSISTWED